MTKKEKKVITGWLRTPKPKNIDEAEIGYFEWKQATWDNNYWFVSKGTMTQKTTEKQGIYPALWISL